MTMPHTIVRGGHVAEALCATRARLWEGEEGDQILKTMHALGYATTGPAVEIGLQTRETIPDAGLRQRTLICDIGGAAYLVAGIVDAIARTGNPDFAKSFVEHLDTGYQAYGAMSCTCGDAHGDSREAAAFLEAINDLFGAHTDDTPAATDEPEKPADPQTSAVE